jgi:excisionase family DNA binding protein
MTDIIGLASISGAVGRLGRGSESMPALKHFERNRLSRAEVEVMMMRRIDTRTDTDRQPYSVKEAAEATGKTKPTILRAIQANRIAARKDEHGRWQIDPAELHRVYRPIAAVHRTDTCTDARGAPGAPHIELLRGILDELRRLTGMLTDPAGEPAEAPATGPAVAVPIENTREALSAPEAKDSDSAELARSAQQAFENGRMADADTLLDLAGKVELAAKDQHALRAAKLIADRGEVALKQLRLCGGGGILQRGGGAGTLRPPCSIGGLSRRTGRGALSRRL